MRRNASFIRSVFRCVALLTHLQKCQISSDAIRRSPYLTAWQRGASLHKGIYCIPSLAIQRERTTARDFVHRQRLRTLCEGKFAGTNHPCHRLSNKTLCFVDMRGGGGDLSQKAVTPTTIMDNSVTSLSKGRSNVAQKRSKFREAIFPIYGRHEVTKFLLLGSLKFFIVMALVLTRDAKDTLVVTQCGAEAIAFLKIYGVLPAATAFIALYSKMASALDRKPLFYATCIPFFVFFGVFDIFIFPNTQTLQPSLELVQRYIGGAKGGGTAIIARVVANWTSALFYVVAEVYASVSIGVLFWQFANDVVSMEQAPRFYPLFAQMSGLAPIAAGQYVVRFASKAANFQRSLRRLTIAIAFAGIAISSLYHVATIFVESSREGHLLPNGSKDKGRPLTKTRKSRMTMTESAKFLASSQYLRLISILVVGYGLSINFTEIMWKSLVKRQYPEALDYQRFMGNFSSLLGFSTCIVIFLGVHVIRLMGWKAGALTTPLLMAIVAVPFFGCILLGLDSPARLRTAVIVGAIQSLLSKTGKYAMFDPTTQMAYIPLDDESKVKGKAAIDVLGSRIGKSGGSFILQGLVLTFGNIIDAAPIVMVLFYSVLFGWMGAAGKLGGLFAAKTAFAHAEKEK